MSLLQRMRQEAKGLEPFWPELTDMTIKEMKKQTGLERVVKLSFNENPFGPSSKAITAMAQALPGLNLYPDAVGGDLRQVLAQGYGLTAEHFALSNGADEMIVLLAQAFLETGDEVLIPFPTFGQYFASTLLMGATPVKVSLTDLTIDTKEIMAKLTAKTKMIFLCNPNNPTGTYLGEKVLREFIELLPKDVLLVLDEAYAEYVTASDYLSGAGLVNQYPNLVVIRTFSKIYGLAGIRAGYAIAQPEVILAINKVRPPFNLNAVAQAGAVAAYQDQEYVLDARRKNLETKADLYQFLQANSLKYIPSETNFLLIDVKEDAQKVTQALAQRGVMLRFAPGWGLPTYIRVSLGSKEEMAFFKKQLLEVLKEG